MARILYLTQGYTPHDWRFLSKLIENAHETWFLPCRAYTHRYESRRLPQGVRELPSLSTSEGTWGISQWLRSLIRLRENLRQIQPQLIHAGPVQGGGFLAALSGFHPLLVMSWGSDVLVDADRSASLRWMTRFTLSRADMVFGDCRAVQNRAVSLSSLKPDQFVLFPWGVELTLFRPRPSDLQLRSKLGWDTNVVLLATRGFQPIHAPLVLLEAFRHTLQSNPHARLIFVGTGSLRPQVDAFIKDYALSDKVYLPGQVLHPSLVDYFNEADIYVSSTMSDGSSISMLEAMACGRPVIVTDGFGNPEWVKPGQNGWLYPAGDAGALALAIREAIDHPAQRETMGHRNRELALAKANWDQNFNLLLSAYARLLEGGRYDAV